mmetsp:Transcript_21597/g.74142  ORF Transcript_21597/g.74142 Transcript_21597/m.74142 type:complete len:235 (-) Transcript_21597:836-1540(-)
MPCVPWRVERISWLCDVRTRRQQDLLQSRPHGLAAVVRGDPHGDRRGMEAIFQRCLVWAFDCGSTVSLGGLCVGPLRRDKEALLLVVLRLQGVQLGLNVAYLVAIVARRHREGPRMLRRVEHGFQGKRTTPLLRRCHHPEPGDVQGPIGRGPSLRLSAHHTLQEASRSGRDARVGKPRDLHLRAEARLGDSREDRRLHAFARPVQRVVRELAQQHHVGQDPETPHVRVRAIALA